MDFWVQIMRSGDVDEGFTVSRISRFYVVFVVLFSFLDLLQWSFDT